MSSEMLTAALGYRGVGWSIIPTVPGSKKAGVKWKKYQEEPAEEAQIREWFGNGRDYGMAVVLGKASGGLCCRDFDVQASYDRWAQDQPELAKALPTVTTARGRHVYFQSNDHANAKMDDGEYRGDGSYCLVPPSQHPDGPLYVWQVPLNGPVPFIADVRAAGLLTSYTENIESAENTAIEYSVCSVYQKDEPRQKLEKTPDIERAIRESLPTRRGRRHRQVFDLARAIKAIPELAGRPSDDLRWIVQDWHARALPFIATKEFTETWIDFLRAWPRVKIPKGAKMHSIMQKALESPMPKAAQRYEDEPIRELVALCRQLSLLSEDRKFFLSCRVAGEQVGVSHTQASGLLFLLQHDGVIEQLNKGDRRGRMAAVYRYLGD